MTGSRREARQAGMAQARVAARSRASVTMMKTDESSPVVAKSMERMRRVTPMLASRPSARPTRAGRRPSFSMRCITCWRVEPSARRTPISVVRWVMI